MMKRAILPAVGVLATVALVAAAPRVHSASGTPTPARSIAVTGDGQVAVPPDVAFVTVGAQSEALEAGKAQDTANRVVAAAIARIKALGIPARDLRTAGIALNPRYDTRGTLTGFRAAGTLAITVERPRQAGAVIDAVVAAGADHDVSMRFGLRDATRARRLALQAAVAAAQRKAQAVAAQLGISLRGAAIRVVENVQQPVPKPATQRAVSPGSTATAPTPIQAGSLTVEDRVTATYTL